MAIEAAFTFRKGYRSISPLSILFLVRLGKRVEGLPRLTASECRALLLDTYNCERSAREGAWSRVLRGTGRPNEGGRRPSLQDGDCHHAERGDTRGNSYVSTAELRIIMEVKSFGISLTCRRRSHGHSGDYSCPTKHQSIQE